MSVSWKEVKEIKEIEDKFRDELAEVLKKIGEEYKFGKYQISVSKTKKFYGREPDIVVSVQDQPFLIIECKRAINYAPWDNYPIGQVYSYALLAKKEGYHVDFVATANPQYMAFFKVPDDLDHYANKKAINKREYEKAFKSEFFSKARNELNIFNIGYYLLPTKEKLYNILNELIKKRREIEPEPFQYRVIERLSSFVEFLSKEVKSIINTRIKEEPSLQKEFEELKKRRGVDLTYDLLSKEFAYSIMNRILFYKVLQRRWKGVKELEPLYGKEFNGEKIDDGEKYFKVLKHYFTKAVETTGDFESVFILAFHDKLTLPSYPYVLKAIDGLIQDLNNIELERLGDVIGYVYEEVIDPKERHNFGQFYTPHGVAELITKWCIRSQSDTVLDPGSGSGTFLVEAYRRLYNLKTGKKLEGMAENEIHNQIIKQLYAIDIDEFACQLTAMNLSMRNILSPSKDVIVIPADFFAVEPYQRVLLPYKIHTVKGFKEREIMLKTFNSVVGNPPYTAWDEIPEMTKNNIQRTLGRLLKEYGLSAKGSIKQKQNPHIYVHWIIHSTRFLKPNGRLGMIVSNLWLQTDYGIKFANFLLKNFKIQAVIDIPLRIFNALITTTIILAEKEENEIKRENNDVVFVELPPNPVEDIEVDEVLKAVKEKKHEKLEVHVYKQKDLSRSDKWIKYLKSYVDIFEKFRKSGKVCEISELYDVCKGNTLWHRITKGAGDGASPFFHLTLRDVRERRIKNYVHPAILSSRYLNFFSFRKDDWENLKRENKKCYMFICHTPLSTLDRDAYEYIRWGENDCKVSDKRGGGEICSKTAASQNRAKRKEFHGWYDLGDVKPAQILAVYQAWHKTRFALCEFPVATYHAILCFFPKVKLTKVQLKALLAYLNSSFAQLYVETEGRKSGGGIIALEISQAERMPVIDPRKLSKREVNKLARLFDNLDKKAREIGGATTKKQIEKLKSEIYKIDREIGKILGLSELDVCGIQNAVEQLIERRLSASKELKRHTIKGEEEIPELKKSEEEPEEDTSQLTLEEFVEKKEDIEMKSKVFGAFAWRVEYVDEDFSEFPPDDAELIDKMNGKFKDLSEVPIDFIRKVIEEGANVITLGQGDYWELYIFENPTFVCPNCNAVVMIPMYSEEKPEHDEIYMAEEFGSDVKGILMVVCPKCGEVINVEIED